MRKIQNPQDLRILSEVWSHWGAGGGRKCIRFVYKMDGSRSQQVAELIVEGGEGKRAV